MWLSGQHITPEIVGRIQSAVDATPEISRTSLARRMCEWLDWRCPTGKLQEGSARKVLAELGRRGVVSLPPARPPRFVFSKRKRDLSPPSTAELACRLADVGEVEIVPVTSRYTKAHAQWTALMEAHHPQGSGPLRGAQIRYLITSSEHGLLGGLSFSAATLRLGKRDSRIGWSEPARQANLGRVIQNSRFLIAPTVEVPNLASHVLAKALGRVAEDWQQRYGVEPVLVETFVDPARFDGACYKAANWQYVGQTAARPDGFANGKVSSGAKDVYLYPLHDRWVEQLQTEPSVEIRRRNWSEMSSDWAECEFGGAQLYDGRLRKRLTSLARDFYAQPGTLVPQMMSGQMAKAVAAYRFFSNERIDMQSLLHGHIEATLERVAQHEVVLAVQDTSTLNYTGLQATEGLGPTNNKADKSVGMMLHPTLAVSMEGTPQGLLDVQCWARDPDEQGKTKDRSRKPIEEKESYRWLRSYQAATVAQRECPDAMVVSVGDREARRAAWAYPEPSPGYGIRPVMPTGEQTQAPDEAEVARQQQIQRQWSIRNALLNLVRNVTMLIVAGPIYFYHWRKIERMSDRQTSVM